MRKFAPLRRRTDGQPLKRVSLQIRMTIEVLRLFVSPGHNYFGHHGQPAGQSPTTEVAAVECVAGRGLRGDRFFDYKEDYKGQITFFAGEVYDELCATLTARNPRLSAPDSQPFPSPAAARRNVLTRGVDLNTLVGKTFEIQGVRFEGVSECSPCYWMDQAFAPGANELLKGRGGLRARILTDGWLHAKSSENQLRTQSF